MLFSLSACPLSSRSHTIPPDLGLRVCAVKCGSVDGDLGVVHGRDGADGRAVEYHAAKHRRGERAAADNLGNAHIVHVKGVARLLLGANVDAGLDGEKLQ